MHLIELFSFDRFFQLTKAPLIIIVIDTFNNMRTHPLPIIRNCRHILGQLHRCIVVKLAKGISQIIADCILFRDKTSRFIGKVNPRYRSKTILCKSRTEFFHSRVYLIHL